MTTDTEIFQTIAKMPKSLKQELLHYAKFLIQNYSKMGAEKKKPAKRGGLGIWKGKIWMADDFDAPLQDFNDYL